MTITQAQLQRIAPIPGALAAAFVAPLNAAIERFGIDTRAAFVAQVLHETANLARMTENLNYTPAALMETFNTRTITRFTPELAALYGRTAAHPANQTMIANVAYANRMGNGSIESGDGWRYRGRGPGLTFKNNYAACGKALGLDLVRYPDMVAQPDVGCLAFGWFWVAGNRTGRDLGILAAAGRIDDVSRAINGGENGLAARRDLTAQAIRAFAKDIA